MKLVSILMPVFNCETYLSEAIESILNQTHSNFELIIINDCSTDRSAEIIKSYIDPRIRCFFSNKNKGIVSTLNSALLQCRGSFVARMDGDDIAHVERIEKQANFLENNPEIGLVGSWYLIRDTHNSKTKIVRRHTDDTRIRFHMLFRNQFLHPGIMMKTNILKNLKYHDVSTCEDYDLWSRVLKHSKVANVPEILMVYRWHGKNVSLINQPAMRKSMIYIISNLLNEYGVEHSPDELLLQTMIALGFKKDQISYLGKLGQLEKWLAKLSRADGLVNKFGVSFLEQEIREYRNMYNFT